MKRSRAILLAVGSAVVAGAATYGLGYSVGVAAPRPPVTDREARNLLAATVAAAHAQDDERLCRDIAASKLMCESFLDDAEREGWQLSTDSAPRVLESALDVTADGEVNRLLRLSVTNADGRAFETDFYVIRTGPHEVRTQTPVYWEPTDM